MDDIRKMILFSCQDQTVPLQQLSRGRGKTSRAFLLDFSAHALASTVTVVPLHECVSSGSLSTKRS